MLFSILQKKYNTHQQNTTDEDDKIIWQEYIPNCRKISGLRFPPPYCSGSRFAGCCAVCLGKCFPRILTKCHLQLRIGSLYGLITLNINAVRLFETSRSSYPITRRNTQKNWFFDMKTALQLKKPLNAVSFPVSQAATLCLFLTTHCNL
jgi:hypothetical protein